MHTASTHGTWLPTARISRNYAIALVIFALVVISPQYLRHRQQFSIGLGPEVSDEHRLRISPKIWQILLPHTTSTGDVPIDPKALEDTPSWIAKNPNYMYTLVGQDGADRFVNKHFADNQTILDTYHGLKNPGLKSDFLRYLILSIEGGVYTDIDTVALKPIDNWVPESMQGLVRLIVGIEFDQRDGPAWGEIPHVLQFCQWTIAAAPGHPVFSDMVSRAVGSLHQLTELYNTTMSELKPSNFEVINATGPAAWTDVVFSRLQLMNPDLVSLRNLSYMTEPTLLGDVLVLPIDGFGMGQLHSASTNNGTIPDAALMKHKFHGSWRGD